jgi:hypothetical protein
VQNMRLIHPYSDQADCIASVRCLKLEEMLAAKLKCLLQRRHSADLFDFIYAVFINKEIEVSRREILNVFLKKTIFDRDPRVARALLLEIPFDFFRGIWMKYIVCPLQSIFDFDTGITGFRAVIEEMFAAAGYTLAGGGFGGSGGRYGSLASVFFPPETRNPIMDAGREQKLLRIQYNGYERTVEPYSLAYKRRKDGVAREYFYCWDRTGGDSEPGLKSMTADKLAYAVVLDEKFAPRYDIELSKAGEIAGKTYFGTGTFGGKTSSRAMVAGSSSRYRSLGQVEYVVQCGVCGKRFKRSSRTTSINPHKNGYGGNCEGAPSLVESRDGGLRTYYATFSE